MALPETDEAAIPQLSLNESYSAAKEGLADADPKFAAMYDDEMAKAMPALMALSDEELDLLLQLVQYLQEHPEEYKSSIQELEQSGAVDKGDFPAEYDENFLAVFGAAVMEAQRTNEDTGTPAPAMQPPMQLAKGGIAEAARMVAASGRSGDTMLAHINKKEAALLKKHGGAGTLNPRTGLREYGWNPVKAVTNAVSGAVKGVGSAISGAVKSVGSAVKSVLSSSVGRIIATVALAAFIGPAAFGLTGAAGVAAQMGLASAGITALSGGNLKDVVRAGTTGAVLGYGGAALGPAVGGSVGVTSATGQAALGAGLTSAGLGAVTGKSIKDSVKDGLTSAAIAGAMTYANSEGVSRGTQGQDPSKVPVDDLTGKPVMPGDAGAVKVDPTTGQVTTSGQTSADPMGDFIAQNEAFRAAANTPVPASPNMPVATAPTQGPAQTQAGADPMGDFIAQNEAWRNAANTPVANPEPSWWDKAKSMVSGESAPTTDEIVGSKQYRELVNKGMSADKAFDMVKADYTPSMLAQYGAPVAAGLGATALLGGFKQETPQPSQESMDIYSGQAARDLMAATPKDYFVQNLPGVQYDDKGAIIGSTPWKPRAASQTEVTSSSYIPYTAPTYTTPSNSIGSRQVAQPYNTSSMYNFVPRYAAQGGMMETQGAFPANPLTMQSSPMMGMEAHQLPMNTSGVPMNLPMGFAGGGIASLSPEHYAVGGTVDWGSAVKKALAGLEPQLKQMFTPLKESLSDMKTYFQAPAPAAPATVSVPPAAAAAVQGAGYAPITAPSSSNVLSNDAARAYDMQKAANARLADYHARMLLNQQAAAPVDAGTALGQYMNPSLYDEDYKARLRAGVRRPQQAATGGIASLAPGGYPRRTGQISGPGTETSDDIPAMLSDGEFVMTAKAVKGMGGGSRRAGAKKMYSLMHRLEKNAARG
jgi:hypothetical protein